MISLATIGGVISTYHPIANIVYDFINTNAWYTYDEMGKLNE